MMAKEELEAENQEIINLAAILAVLIDKVEFRSNPVFCDMLHRFMDKISQHLSHEARSVYSDLLSDSNKETNHAASQFNSNAHELEKILGGYTKRWCVPIPSTKKHEEFVAETQEIFRLLNERIDMENNHLFPYLSQQARH